MLISNNEIKIDKYETETLKDTLVILDTLYQNNAFDAIALRQTISILKRILNNSKKF